ncbi:pantothenate transporter [Aspergillus ambiguus]|uniref:pantothenate transporter n=1 Tax=Aspergillus ambiguus TaxID=176160 RepID=UPI003CCE2D07
MTPQVAVIGAGISGVVSAAHLLQSGIEVVVFERNLAAGGVWLYDERQPLEPRYPSISPSIADQPDTGPDSSNKHIILKHAPPGPCYESLKNNVSTPLMCVKLRPWPKGTDDFVSHRVLKQYIQDISYVTGVHEATVFGARVTNVYKREDSWRLHWTILRERDSGIVEPYEDTSIFDAVIVASGHYHAPRIPDIPTLSEVKARWPERIRHSKAYRKPHLYKNRTVLLIGGGVSSIDIARDLGPFAKKVYQSTRNGEFDISEKMLPDNGTRIGEIRRLEVQDGIDMAPKDTLPIVAHLKAGQRLSGIDYIIICTGYHITLPFLQQYHDDDMAPESANDTVLVTDGTQVHNLHKDIFYIPDPTLSFVGIPYYTATFSLFEFQAIAIAAVFTGVVPLPSCMRLEYLEKKKLLGSGRKFHSLKDKEEEYVLEIIEWVNLGREKYGLPRIEGHTQAWHEAKVAQRERLRLLFEPVEGGRNGKNGVSVRETCVGDVGTVRTEETAIDYSAEITQKDPKKRWASYIWDTFDKSPEERRLLFKLDSAILTFASLGYFIKYLDQVNINNAFVSGMKEDVGLYANQLNYIQACWTVGYVIGEVPSNILLTRIRPRYWLPTMELIWTVLTFSLSRCNTATQFYVLRFFIGLAESTFYPGMQYLIGSWYRKDELAKRSCIFHTSSGIASMFSGYLMAAVYNLEGRGGFRGWQWLFVMDGIISLPIALSGYFLLPDVPEIANPWYLSEKEVALAQKRMELEGRNKRGPFSKAKLKKIFSSWHIYLLTVLYITFNNGATGGQPIFQQFLKASKNPTYSVAQINAYPTTTSAVQVATTLVYAWTSDSILRGRRWPPILFGALVNIVSYVSLAVWDIPIGWKWTCYIICGAGFGLSGLCMAWAHEICSNDNEERALVVGTMNEMAYVFQAWLPLVVWQQVDAPRYNKGFIAVTIMSVLLIVTTLTIRALQQKEDTRGYVIQDPLFT